MATVANNNMGGIMKLLLSMAVLFGVAFTGSQSQAQYSRATVVFKTVGCGFFGGLYAKVEGQRRNVNVNRNGLRCKDAKEQLLAAIRAGGNNFEADVYDRSQTKTECDRDDDGDRRCETYRIRHRVFEIPNLRFNNFGFTGEMFLGRQRIR